MKALVTGGGGFLGGGIVRCLVQRGDQVRSFSRGTYPALAELGVDLHRGDLADFTAVGKAVAGCDCVFHVAALPGIWGPYDSFYQTNVIGTKNVIAACLAQGVRRLIYTSSPSVVFHGQDMRGVNESVPYPPRYLAHYPATKAQAEQAVLAANSSGLATVALRPHLIWGPGDNHLVPRILDRGRRGQLRRIGQGNPTVDSTYIDDAIAAHLLAADRLEMGGACAGKAYFISSGEPWPLWDLVNGILKAGGIAPVTRFMPAGVAWAAGGVLESLYWMFGIKSEPRMTRFLAKELSTDHWFDISAARRDFGYSPRVSVREGLDRLSHSLNGCAT